MALVDSKRDVLMHLIQGGGVWGGGDSVCAPRPAHVVCMGMGMGTDQCIWAVSSP